MTTGQLETSLSMIHDWIRNADNKVSITLAFNGISFVTLLSKSLGKLVVSMQTDNTMFAGYFAVVLLLCYSTYKLFAGLYPKLEHGQSKLSPLYFGDIASLKFDEFSKKTNSINTAAKYADELKRQIHACSKIAVCKYDNFKSGLVFSLIAISLFGIMEIWSLNLI